MAKTNSKTTEKKSKAKNTDKKISASVKKSGNLNKSKASEHIFSLRNVSIGLPDFTKKPLLGSAPLTTIIPNVSFDVPRQSVVGIVGESGSGKSTLGRAMLGLIPIQSGELIFDGKDIAKMTSSQIRPLRQDMQMIFQDPMSSLNPRLRIGEIITAPLRAFGYEDDIENRLNRTMELVGLPRSFISRYPHELSGGERQRVGVARGVVMPSKFVLADEIASGLDVSNQAIILKLLTDLVEEVKLSVAFISHDLSVISRISDRVIVLYKGEIVENEPTRKLFTNPKHPYTKTLIDAIPLPEPDSNWVHN